MPKVVAIHGSPRRRGNTSSLLRKAVDGAREAGAQVEEVILRDIVISPCLECYGCKKDGRCVIKDDFQQVVDSMIESQGIILASPVFFYAVTAQTKALMDRCQSLWVKKHWVDNIPFGQQSISRKGLFISVGATKGKQLFDGTLLSVRYFFDVLDAQLWKSLLYRGLDHENDIDKHPEYLEGAFEAGKDLCRAIQEEL